MTKRRPGLSLDLFADIIIAFHLPLWKPPKVLR
jgi:hypothetical protein